MKKIKYTLETVFNRPWFVIEEGQSKGKVRVPTLCFIDFLGELGYRQIFTNGYFQIARLENNIIAIVNDYSEIIEVAKKWLNDNATGNLIEGVYVDEIESAWINKTPQLFSPLNLRFLPKLEVELCKDTIDCSYFFFKNTVVKVTKKDIEELGYSELSGHVFSEDIINRNFNKKKIKRLFRYTPYARFIHNISGKKPHRVKAFMTIAGCMQHRYKNPAKAKAIILYDEPINELNTASGASGKSCYIQGLSHMRNLCDIPGKDFDANNTFKLQRASRNTNIIALNDIQANLNFERLYNAITEDLVINKKYKPEMVIKFEDGPKFILASNYIIKAPAGVSTERRKYEIEFSTYYGKLLSIFEDFGHFFYYDWDDKQWNDFSMFMMLCTQYYLNFGLISAPPVNLNERRLIAEVKVELIEFLDEKFAEKTKHHKKELFKEFITGGYVESRFKPTLRTFTIKLKKYLEYKGFNYHETPANTKAFIEIITDEDPINFTTINDVDTDYRTVDTSNKMTRMVNTMTKHFAEENNSVLALDFETTGLDVFTDDAVSLALSFKPKTGYNVMLPANTVKCNKLLKPLLPFLSDTTITKVFHNAKFDLKFMWRLNIELAGEVYDTMIMNYVLDPSIKKHGLKEISKLHLNYQMIEFKQMTGDKSITEVDTKDLTAYAVEDADITFQLHEFLTNKLK